jgi:hypothetical protein
MKSIVHLRHISIAGAVCAAAAWMAGCATAPPPPVAEAPPAVTVPAKLVQAATAYVAYVDKAAAITPDFENGEMVAVKLKEAAAYNAVQFQRGEAAYGAIVALQDPAFVAAVRAYTTDSTTKAQIVNEIMKDPAYVVGIKGSDSAAGLVIAALDSQGTRILRAGEKVKQAAYDVQRKPWSKATVPDREARLAAVKGISSMPMASTAEQTAQLQMASTGQTPLTLTGAPLAPPYTPLVVRSLAVAALAVLGHGGDANAEDLWAVINEPNQSMCFNMAKLNLNQCLAVSKPHYEDVFCLGVHILMDTGSCIIKGAGAPKTAPAIIAAAAPASASAMPAATPAPIKTP